MRTTKPVEPKRSLGWKWSFGLGAVLFIAILAAAEPAEARERVSKTSERTQTERQAIPRSPSGGGKVATAPRGPARTPNTGRSGSGGYDTSYRRHGYNPYGHRYGHRYGYYGLGYYGYSPYYLMYHRGYAPYHLYYGPYGYSRHYGGPTRSLGAVDLNVKPKKAEVYLDGKLVGRAGEFDGFPGYLWLEEGTHQLIFHRDGFETVVREVKVMRDVVVDVRERMADGVATPIEEFPAPPAVVAPRAAEAPTPMMEERVVELDATSEPGRLTLRVEPGDASVYLDGRFIGTGDDLSRLQAGVMVDPGSHTVEIVRPGYATETLEFEVDSDAQAELVVELERNVA